MGACLGSVKSKKKGRHYVLQRCSYHSKSDTVEMDLLMEKEETDNDELPKQFNIWTMSESVPSFFVVNDKKKRGFRRLERDLTGDDSLHRPELADCEKDDTQLMPLDAHSLLASRALQRRKISCSSSTPPSSIDLEWENEDQAAVLVSTSFQQRRLPSYNLEENSSESGMGGTSPESLEWDPCDQTATDLETEQLISEIERLTSRALYETGDWTDR